MDWIGKFWSDFFANAKKIGLKPRHIILIVLAVLAFSALKEDVSVFATLAVVVVLYCLDPILDLIKAAIDRRNAIAGSGVEKTQFRQYSKRKRKELSAENDQLSLPLPEKSGVDVNEHN